MKFNVLGACALVAAAATATSSTSPILGAESVSNDYRELLRVDCKGVLHFLHGTPFETDWDLTFIKAALDTYRARIKERALARCPDITEEEINRRLAPSLDLVFNYLFGDDDKDTYETCTGTFNDGVLQLGAFTNLITAGTCMNSYVSLDISDLFPITCSPPSWNQDGTCFVKGKFSDVVGGMEINVAATNCSTDSAWPFLSLHCQGASCVNYFKPCSDVNSVTQCGDTMKCTDLGTLIGSSVDIEQTITSYLAYAGLWHESIPSSNVWTAVVRPIREFWGSYFSGAQVGANKNDYLKFCFPKPEYQGKTYNDFFSMIGEVLYYEEEVSCTYLPGCAPPANCPNPFYEFGCNPMTGKKSEDSLNVTLLFKTIDEKELALDAARDYLFTGECSEEKNLPVGCLGKDITIKNTGTYSYLCHAASNGRCGFHMIGDGFCDPACDREECSYDGVDCLGPAEKVAPQIRLYTCDISEKEMIASNSPCIDSYQNSICIQKEIDLERYQSTSCAGPTGPTNQDCCTCNDTTIYTAVPKYDLRSEIVEFKVSGNLVFPWDGKIGNLLVTSQKDLTTEFPVSTYTQGETKFVSLDCNGFATFSLVTPFARAKATGLLATVKFAEQAVLSIAKLRQQNQPGGTFVGADGYFTKLGYQHFGVFTLAYPLWQYTTAIRCEARGADFTKYEGTTPGSLLMREWDPKKSATVSHLVVGDIPSSCSFSKYVTDKTCMLQYSVPILTKIGVDLKIKGGVAACPNTHIPQISSSISGTWLNPFPFISPCLNDAGCPSSHECVNIFEYVNTIAFTTTGKKLPDLEYDLFSLILFGKAGRDPNWGARTSAWSTEDAVYILRNWFGGYKNPNPFTPTPNYNLGEVKLCFPKNDPVLVPILKTGVPYDWGTAGQDVNWTTTAYESDPKFNVSMEKISFVGLSSLATQPPGIVDYSTPPPTKSPTTVADVGAGAQSTFNGFTAYAVASIALIFSIMFVAF